MTPPRIFYWKSSAWTVQKQLSAAIHFRKFLQEIPVAERFFWSNYRLTVHICGYILKWLHQECFFWKSSAWTVQKQLSTAIHFRKFLQKMPVVESFFGSNYRLAAESSDYILKWLHWECFLGNLPKAFGEPKYHRL